MNTIALRQTTTATIRRPATGAAFTSLTVSLLAAATIVAVSLVPSAVATENALLWSTWAFGIAMIARIVFDVRAHGFMRLAAPVNVIFGGVLVILLAEPLQPNYSVNLYQEVVQEEFIAIGLFLAFVVIGAGLAPLPVPKRLLRLAAARYSSLQLRILIFLCFVIGMMNFVAGANFNPTTLMQGLLSARFEAPWSRGALGGWDAFRDFLTFFGYPLPTLCVLLAHHRKHWLLPDVIGGLICSGIFLLFVSQGGGRRLLVDIVGSALITFILVNRNKVKFRHVAIAVVVVFGTAYAANYMLHARTAGFSTGVDTGEKTELRVDDNFWSFGEVIKAIPNEHDYVYWGMVIYVGVRPMPRIFWPNKPVDPGFDLAAHMGRNDVLYSTTVLGESYFSWGLAGVALGGLVFGLLANFWSSFLAGTRSPVGYAVYAMGAMALFLGIRSYIELTLMAYPIILWLIWDLITGSRTRRA